MHETMTRLYEAAQKIKSTLPKPAVIAKLVHVTTQTVVNWEARGISADGMIDAEEFIGCSAAWLRSGMGPMEVGQPYEAPATERLADSMKRSSETAAELQMLIVHRLSDRDARMLIDDAVQSAMRELKWTGIVGDQSK